MRIHLGTTVCEVRPDPTFVSGQSVHPASSEVLYANPVGADCVKNKLQSAVTGRA